MHTTSCSLFNLSRNTTTNMFAKTCFLLCNVVVLLSSTFAQAGGRRGSLSFFSGKKSNPVAETFAYAPPPARLIKAGGIPPNGIQYNPATNGLRLCSFRAGLEEGKVWQIHSVKSSVLCVTPSNTIGFMTPDSGTRSETIEWMVEYVDDNLLVLKRAFGIGYLGTAVDSPESTTYRGHLVPDQESAQRFQQYGNGNGWYYLKAAGDVHDWWFGTTMTSQTEFDIVYYRAGLGEQKHPVAFIAVNRDTIRNATAGGNTYSVFTDF